MIWLLAIPLVFILALFIYPHLATKPDDLGLRNGKLKACPDTPNCVSSFADNTDETHYISPLAYKLPLTEAITKIKDSVSQMPGMTVIKSEENYLYFEAKTRIFRYIDDLEIYLNEEQKLIHFRSASRIGQSDFGANRKRVEAIKEQLSASGI